MRLLCKIGSLKWSRLKVSVFKWSFWWFMAQLVNSCISSPEKVLNCTFRMGTESCLKTGFSAGGRVSWSCILQKDQRESRGCCFHFMSEFIKIIVHNLFTSMGFLYITENYIWPFYWFYYFSKTVMQLLINLSSARRKLHTECLSKVLNGCCMCSGCRSCPYSQRNWQTIAQAHVTWKFPVKSCCSYQLCCGVNQPYSWKNILFYRQ